MGLRLLLGETGRTLNRKETRSDLRFYKIPLSTGWREYKGGHWWISRSGWNLETGVSEDRATRFSDGEGLPGLWPGRLEGAAVISWEEEVWEKQGAREDEGIGLGSFRSEKPTLHGSGNGKRQTSGDGSSQDRSGERYDCGHRQCHLSVVFTAM